MPEEWNELSEKISDYLAVRHYKREMRQLFGIEVDTENWNQETIEQVKKILTEYYDMLDQRYE